MEFFTFCFVSGIILRVEPDLHVKFLRPYNYYLVFPKADDIQTVAEDLIEDKLTCFLCPTQAESDMWRVSRIWHCSALFPASCIIILFKHDYVLSV